ncbi:FG-GAP repeat [Fimbriimonadaceae bacterium]
MSPQGASSDTLENHPELKLALSQSQRQIQSVDGSFSGEQPGRYQFGLAPSGRLTVGDLSIRTVAFGNGENAVATVRPSSALGKDELGFSKLTFKRPGISEWYINEAEGLHHWFQVDKKVGEGNLWVKLAASGAKGIQVSQEKIDFATNQGNLSYAGLKVWDATGKQLPASMQLRGSEIVIGIEDASATYPVTIDPTWTEEAVLSASDKSQDAQFGESVSVSGDTAIVGTPSATSSGLSYAGQAYVFTRSGSTWTEQQILSASDKSQDAQFGWSVSVSGDTAIVGAPSANSSGLSYAGQAYVFTRSGSTWTQQQILSASDKSEYANFGSSVSVSGDTAIVGATSATPNGVNYPGQAYVFTRSGSTWTQQQILSASDKSEYANFGSSVSVSGDTAIVGATSANSSGLSYAGQAYVFTRSGSTWTEQQILIASDKAASANFGSSVSVSGDTAIVGARDANSSGLSYAGQAYVFRLPSDIAASVAFGTAGVSGGKSIIGTVTLTSAPTASTVVSLSSNNAALTVPASVTVAAGSTTATFTATSSVVTSDTLVTVTASGTGITSGNGQITVRTPRVSGVTFSVDAFTLGQSATGTITLQSPAPAGGTLVTLANGNSDALDCPATVTVPAGQSRATFTVTGKSVGVATTVKVEATPSFNEKSDTITVNPAFDVSVADFVLGGTGQGQVTLSAPAPAGGAVVSLSASSLRLSVPATVTVPEGGTTASFSVSATGAVQNALVRATYLGASKTDTVSVVGLNIATVTSSSSTISVGRSATITVTLNAATPQDLAITISRQKAGVVSAPVQLVIPAGSISGTFEVTGLAPGATNVYVRLLSQGTKSAKITVTNP